MPRASSRAAAEEPCAGAERGPAWWKARPPRALLPGLSGPRSLTLAAVRPGTRKQFLLRALWWP